VDHTFAPPQNLRRNHTEPHLSVPHDKEYDSECDRCSYRALPGPRELRTCRRNPNHQELGYCVRPPWGEPKRLLHQWLPPRAHP
ncbi:unnamed protein product, partial [Discosporangium mesarthrocarpum]